MPEPIAEILRGFSNIEAFLCRHVHRTMIKRWTGTVVVSCPSTTKEIALQWQPDAAPQTFLGPPACIIQDQMTNPIRAAVSVSCAVQTPVKQSEAEEYDGKATQFPFIDYLDG